jgi:hypothetical protein
LEDVPLRCYWINETIAPDGYARDTDTEIICVTEGTMDVTVEFENYLGSITIHKFNEDGSVRLGGATFSVQPHPYDGAELLVTDNVYPDADLTDGKIVLEGVPLRCYWINETVAPAGYALDDTTHMVCVTDSTLDVEVSFYNTLPPGCTHTWGFWKTHAGYGPQPEHPAWRELDPTLGPMAPFFGTGETYIEILNMTPSGGNAYLILAHQYIATELNELDPGPPPNPPLPGFIAENMTAAVSLLTNPTYEGAIDITPKDNPHRALAIQIAGILDDFNNGLYFPGPGWPHCDNPPLMLT